MKPITLTYEMRLLDPERNRVYLVEKYWHDDTDPMGHKVSLTNPLNDNNCRSYYCCDLVELIKGGVFEICK